VWLIVVDDYDALPRPSQGDRMVGQGVLPFPRFAVIEDLVRGGLANINERQSVQVPVLDLGRSPTPGGRCRAVRGSLGRVMARHAPPPFRPETPRADELRRG